jgi:hypothetical protein
MPAPKNTVLAECYPYEGYGFSEVEDKPKRDLERDMRRLANNAVELMQYVKPSKRTLGAKAYRVYLEQKRLLAAKRARASQAKKKRLGEPRP